MREEVERGTAPRSQWSHRQHSALDRRRASHFLSMREPFGDLLSEAAKRVREVGKFGQRCFQVVKQAQVEIVLAKRPQRIGVESDRMIERLKSPPNLHHHCGKKSRVLAAEFLQFAAVNTQNA